ncbi:MAG: hypothetical protein AB1486_01730 [Planctomycetota bacterium]
MLAATALLVSTFAGGVGLALDERAPPLVPFPLTAPLPADHPARRDTARQLAERRRGVVLLSAIATADTQPCSPIERGRELLEAGADGWSFPVAACADGTLVVIDAERLEDRLDGLGALQDTSREELLFYRYRDPVSGQRLEARAVLLDEVLREAWRLGAFLVPEPLSGEIASRVAASFAQHAAFPLLVFTPGIDSALASDPRYQPLPWRGLLTDPSDALDRAAAASLADKPGQLVWTSEARLVAAALGRGCRELPPIAPEREEATEGRAREITSQALEVLHAGSDGLLEPLVACKRAAARLTNARASSAGPTLVALLEDKAHPGPARAAAAWALGMLASHAAAAPSWEELARAALLTAAGAEWPVGPEALLALGRFKDARVIPHACRVLRDTGGPDRERHGKIILHRQAAATALGWVGSAGDEVATLLEQTLAGSSFHSTASLCGLDGAAAARALGELHVTDAIDGLVAAAREPDPELTARARERPVWPEARISGIDARQRREAVFALGRIGSKSAADALDTLLRMPPGALDESLARSWVAGARLLGCDDGSRAVDLLSHPNAAVRAEAFALLSSPRNDALREDAARAGLARFRESRLMGLALLVRACVWAGDQSTTAVELLEAARACSDASIRTEAATAGS